MLPKRYSRAFIAAYWAEGEHYRALVHKRMPHPPLGASVEVLGLGRGKVMELTPPGDRWHGWAILVKPVAY